MKSTFPLALGVMLLTSGAAFAADTMPADSAKSPAGSAATTAPYQAQMQTKDTTTTTTDSATTATGEAEPSETVKTSAEEMRKSETSQTSTTNPDGQTKASPVVENGTNTEASATNAAAPGQSSTNVQKLFTFLQHNKQQTQAGATTPETAVPSDSSKTTTPATTGTQLQQ